MTMSANLAFSVKMLSCSSLKRIIALIIHESCSLLDNTLRFTSLSEILPELTSGTGPKSARIRPIIHKPEASSRTRLVSPAPAQSVSLKAYGFGCSV